MTNVTVTSHCNQQMLILIKILISDQQIKSDYETNDQQMLILIEY